MLSSLLLFLSGFLFGFSYYATLRLKDSVVWGLRAVGILFILLVLLNPPV